MPPGKGVVVAMSEQEAHDAIDMMLEGHTFGNAGARVVIEDFLDGEEASFIVMVDGENILPMATSQDHKRLLDADQGPNTGGMGAYSPGSVVTPDIHAQVMREIIRPTVPGHGRRRHPLHRLPLRRPHDLARRRRQAIVRTLEFNCRFGDPETQPIMMRVKSDFSEIIEAGIDGKLDSVEVGMGSPAPHSASSAPPAATRLTPKRAPSSKSCLKTPPNRWSSTPARPSTKKA